jgi:type IV secretion system protein VirD4
MIDPSVKRFTSASLQPPDFTELQRASTGVYWVLHEQDLGYLRPLSALFYTLAIYQLSQRQASAERPMPVTFFLDEFANCGTIIGFDSILTLSRGRDLAFVIGIQALSQVLATYGRERGETIINNLRTMLILPGIRGRSAEEISRELGDTTRTGQHYSSTRTPDGLLSERVSETTSTHEWRRRLLTADEVRRLGEDPNEPNMIAIITNRRALKLYRHWYDAQPLPAQSRALGRARVGAAPLPEVESKPAPPPPLPKLPDLTL